MKLGRTHTIALASVAVTALGAAVPGAAIATKSGSHKPNHGKKTHNGAAGYVYTETNDPTANTVVVLKRAANGKLTHSQTIATGGQGGLAPQPGCTPPGGCPILDTDNEVTVTGNGRLVFAVNAGSNTITSFRQQGTSLKRVSEISSGGMFPNSVTAHGNLLYALNSASLTISGFRFDASGHLSAISGSTRPLAGQTVPGLARQIGFDGTGRVLVVTLFGNPMLAVGDPTKTMDTFLVGADGKPSTAIVNDASTPFPFGFAFSSKNVLVMSQATNVVTPNLGDGASYSVSSSGALSAISTKATGGNAPCWVAITGDGKYAFIDNTGGGAPGGSSVSRFRLSNDGSLTLLGNNVQTSGEFVKTDVALSRDSKYLYVLNHMTNGLSGPSEIDEYKVGRNGSLSLIGMAAKNLAPGASGLAAR